MYGTEYKKGVKKRLRSVLAGIQRWVYLLIFLVLHHFSWNVSSSDTNEHEGNISGKKRHSHVLPWSCQDIAIFPFFFASLRYVCFDIKETDGKLNEHRHLMRKNLSLGVTTKHKWNTQVCPEICYSSGDKYTSSVAAAQKDLLLSAVEKRGGEESSFAVAS